MSRCFLRNKQSSVLISNSDRQHNGGKYPQRDPTANGGIKQSRDSDGVNNYQQSNNGKLVYNSRGHPLCNYCEIPSHPRSACRQRLRDVENGIKRNSHPARGTMSSNNQARREAQARSVAAADHWNSHAPAQHPPTNQMTQWAGQVNLPAPMIVTITDPEDQ